MTVGERIKQLRKKQHLTLKDVSKKTNISLSFLSDIENNRSNPSLDRLKDIALALNTPVSFLLGEYTTTMLEAYLDYSPIASIKNPRFNQILSGLKDFDNWSDEDINELIYYLRAKQSIRSHKKELK